MEQDKPSDKHRELSLYSSSPRHLALLIVGCLLLGVGIVEYGSRVIRPGLAENLGAPLIATAAWYTWLLALKTWRQMKR